tara:strand:- start:1006 stop:2070 length:1065 start_codon:yes stop_codon:yes gene_type:complete
MDWEGLPLLYGGWAVTSTDAHFLSEIDKLVALESNHVPRYISFGGLLFSVERIHHLARVSADCFTPLSFGKGRDMLGGCADIRSKAYRHAKMCQEYESIVLDLQEEVLVAAHAMLHATRGSKTLLDVVADARVIQYLIGYNHMEFCDLFAICLPELQRVFPMCHPIEGSNASLQLKLFCFLWRCRLGVSYRAMQALTGINGSLLCQYHIKIENIVVHILSLLHPKVTSEELVSTGRMFSHLYNFLGKRFKIGCYFDNFYVLIPRPGDDELQESLYSGYKGAHCVKALMVSKSVGMGILEVTLMYPSIADSRSTHTSRVYEMLENNDVLGGGDKGYRSEAHNGKLVTVSQIALLY